MTHKPRSITLALLVIVVVIGGVPLRAGAALVTDDITTGNGKKNRNLVTARSPTINHGIQHVNNSNVSGSTNTQAAFCRKKFRHCRITQRLIVFDP